jgi:hypothetical protein
MEALLMERTFSGYGTILRGGFSTTSSYSNRIVRSSRSNIHFEFAVP